MQPRPLWDGYKIVKQEDKFYLLHSASAKLLHIVVAYCDDAVSETSRKPVTIAQGVGADNMELSFDKLIRDSDSLLINLSFEFWVADESSGSSAAMRRDRFVSVLERLGICFTDSSKEFRSARRGKSAAYIIKLPLFDLKNRHSDSDLFLPGRQCLNFILTGNVELSSSLSDDQSEVEQSCGAVSVLEGCGAGGGEDAEESAEEDTAGAGAAAADDEVERGSDRAAAAGGADGDADLPTYDDVMVERLSPFIAKVDSIIGDLGTDGDVTIDMDDDDLSSAIRSLSECILGEGLYERELTVNGATTTFRDYMSSILRGDDKAKKIAILTALRDENLGSLADAMRTHRNPVVGFFHQVTGSAPSDGELLMQEISRQRAVADDHDGVSAPPGPA